MKFFATYKCPMCDVMFTVSDKPFEMNRDQGPELVGKIIANQQMLGNPYLYQAPMYIPHDCANGCVGIAQLSGFAPEGFVRRSNGQKSTDSSRKRRGLLSLRSD